MSQPTRNSLAQWTLKRDQLTEDAKTLSCHEMARKHGIKKKAMRYIVDRLGIRPVAANINWEELKDDFAERVKTMNAKQLAAHYGCSVIAIRGTLVRFNLKAAREVVIQYSLEDQAAVLKLAATKTATEIARHLNLTYPTVRKHLERAGVTRIEQRTEGRWLNRKAEIQTKIIEGWTSEQLAEHYGCTVPALRNALSRIGVGIKDLKITKSKKKQHGKASPPKAQQIKQTKPEPKPLPRRPVQIVTPDNVKYTIAPFSPPPGSRICNGSSTTTYNPAIHGGATTSYR